MPDEEQRLDDLKETERMLAEFAPRARRLNTARLMYLAGRESAMSRRWTRWCWPASTTALACVVAVLTAMVAAGPQPTIVYLQAPATELNEISPAADAPAPVVVQQHRGANYLQNRALALSRGADAIPATGPGGRTTSTTLSRRRMIEDLLREQFGVDPQWTGAGHFDWSGFLQQGQES